MSEIPEVVETTEETVIVPKKQYDEIVAKAEAEEKAKNNLVGEITELRKKAREAAPAPAVVPAAELTPEKVAEIAAGSIQKVLAEKDQEAAQSNMESALRAFQAKYPEFNPENDEGGIKSSALKQKLARFNLGGLQKTEDFLTVFEDARKLVFGGDKAPEGSGANPNPIAPQGGSSAPVREAVNEQLSVKEMNLIDRLGWDKDRYLKQKLARPDYIEHLLSYTSN